LDGGSPLFALRIDRGHYIATIEHRYETKDVKFSKGSEISQHVTTYHGPGSCVGSVRALDHHVFGNSKDDFKELQVGALLATSASDLPAHLDSEFSSCTDLVTVTTEGSLPDDIFAWSRFIIRVAPTQIKDQDGILELWTGDVEGTEEVLVARAVGEFGHAGYLDPAANDGPPPGEGLQYFKIGPYRDKVKIWGDEPAAIHIRNIKRGHWERSAVTKVGETLTMTRG
jgi:hypothetical protein